MASLRTGAASSVHFAPFSVPLQPPLTPLRRREYAPRPAATDSAAGPGTDSHAILFARVPHLFRGGVRGLLVAALASRPRVAAARGELLLLRMLEPLAGVPHRRHVGHGLRRRMRTRCVDSTGSSQGTARRQFDRES